MLKIDINGKHVIQRIIKKNQWAEKFDISFHHRYIPEYF